MRNRMVVKISMINFSSPRIEICIVGQKKFKKNLNQKTYTQKRTNSRFNLCYCYN